MSKPASGFEQLAANGYLALFLATLGMIFDVGNAAFVQFSTELRSANASRRLIGDGAVGRSTCGGRLLAQD